MTTQAGSLGYAFSANGLDFSLSSYRMLADGRLRHMGHRPIGKASSDIAIHPSGRFVFVISKTMATIAVYRLNRDSGDLTPVEGSPFPSEVTSPFRIAFHPSGRFVYVAARFTGVGAYSFDQQTGTLTPLPGSPYLARERTRSVVVHPSGRFLYAVNSYDNSVSSYEIDQQSGALQEMSGSPFSVGDMGVIDYDALFMSSVPAKAGGIPYNITLDPQGRFAFVSNWAAASVSVFRIDPDSGQLVAVEGSPFFTGFNPYAVGVHASGRFLYVGLYSGEIAVHAIGADSGRLTQVPGSPFTTGAVGPVALIFNAVGDQLYVPHYETNDVVLLDIDTASGALKVREALKTRTGPWGLALSEGAAPNGKKQTDSVARSRAVFAHARDIIGNLPGFSLDAVVMGPDKRFAYALDQARARLVSFVIDAKTGEPTPLAEGVQATGAAPSDISIDANGWYLYVTNGGANSMSVYYLNPDNGIPRPVRGPPTRTGKRPASIALDPAARYAFVANADANTVSVYRYMNGITPLIYESRKYGSPFATGERPVAVAVEPTGHFAYVANAGSNDISAYRIHYKIGALTELPGSPFKTGTRPVAVLAHPNGKLLFVANAEAKEIAVFRIEQALGALSAGPRLRLAQRPRALWLNPAGTELTVLTEKDNKRLYFAVDAEHATLTPQERNVQ
jgi:6-phosphogluconolactonase (cycloisomerase 2 family)